MAFTPPMIEAVTVLLPALLGTLERVIWVQRNLHPTLAPRLAAELAPRIEVMTGPLGALESLDCPEDFRFVRDRLVDVTRQTLDIVTAFVEAARSSGEPFELYRALRRFARLQETLYPLAPMFESVNRWFLEPARRDDDALVARLGDAAGRDDDVRVGILHAKNDRDARGGFSLYVPETFDGRTPMPLVVALHGGSGHGRDFLWSWLREARSRGVLVLSPTSRDRTWSIMGREDADADGLRDMVEFVAGEYPVDRGRVLLTGMSDGATYALLCGLREGMPFTHLAPACGVLHPLLLVGGGIERARDRPIYMVHGKLDWMFPVQTAQLARDALLAVGARLVYREIEDLSHTYPRDENPAILEWLRG
jgi:phospholipase/carboxylesterase